ncbi:MAG: hypothetical protein NTY75_01290 [Candidatus Shapirobacteria bacterium]|nr:hypothetical protein [Candidatus Shapirobacteria bacterium]
MPRYLHSYVSGSPVTKLKSEPTSSSYTHNATYGIGRIWNYSLSSSSTAYGFLRGGDWNNIGNAGAFTLYLNITPVYRNYNLGFRCASDPVALSQSQSSSIGRGAAGGEVLVVPAVADAKFTQSINLGEVASYDFSAYVYDTTSSGGAVSETVAQLYFNGAVVNPTTYTAVTGETGWYKLTGTVTSTNSAVEYGLFVKAGKTVRVDDFTLSKSGTAYSVFTKNGYFKNDVSSWDSFSASVTNNGTNGSVVYQLCTDDLGDAAAVGQGTACQAQNKWKWWNGSAWVYATNSTTEVNTAAQLTQAVMQHASLGTSSKKISVKAILSFGGVDYPKIATITLGLTTDTTPPTNATGLYMNNENGVTCTDTDNCWTKLTGPTFSWTAGSDTQSPTVRYCVYLGTDAAGEPATDKGKLGTSPVTVPVGWTCQFLISATSLDLSTAGYLATALSNADVFTTTANTYYLKIKAVDNGGNTSTTSLSMKFRYDGTAPTNVTSINPASGNFSNVSDMNFSWPVSPAIAASIDNESQVLGWQYQINPSVDTNGVTTSAWKGTTHSTNFNLDYIPATASAYTFVTSRDSDGSSVGVGKVSSGTNQIYFRTVDNVGNFSSNATIRTGSISFGGIAPSFIQTDSVTITPDSATTNSYALSWPAATATTNKTVTHYYYMINASPPTTLATLQGNASTYIDNGTATTVAVRALPNVNKGTNTVRVVAIDSATVPNYSSSNVISGTFVLDSDIPDNVGNLVASDSSIKSQSQWNVTLTWTAPVYQGAGNLTYIVKRSTDNVTFTQVGTSTGLSYVDNAPASALYYYEVITKDNTADGYSSGTNAVSITPTGKWTTAPTLDSGPDEGSITTIKATISW